MPDEDNKLAADEARRVTQHEDVKATLQREVNRAVAAEASHDIAASHPQVAAVGKRLEERAVNEVVETDREVARTRGGVRVAQWLDYVFFVIYALIAVEIVLEAAGARDSNGFKRAMDVITAPFLAPFHGLFSDPAIGEYRFMFSYLAGLVAWILLHLAIRGLIRVFAQRRTTF